MGIVCPGAGRVVYNYHGPTCFLRFFNGINKRILGAPISRCFHGFWGAHGRWWFQIKYNNICLFSSLVEEMIHFDKDILSIFVELGGKKTPTSN